VQEKTSAKKLFFGTVCKGKNKNESLIKLIIKLSIWKISDWY